MAPPMQFDPEISNGPSISTSGAQSQPPRQLPDLPVEILELISEHLVRKNGQAPWTFEMLDFRLTCKDINEKTLDLFSKLAFSHLTIHLTLADLCWINDISEHPSFASKVRTVEIALHDRCLNAEELRKAQELLASSEGSSSQHRRARRKVQHVHFESSEKFYVERSAADGIMLFTAFQRLSNLREVVLPCVKLFDMPIRKEKDGQGPSTGRIFSMLLTSLSHANRKLVSFRMKHGRQSCEEAFPVSMLAMPANVLSCLSQLRQLDLWLEADDYSYKNQELWQCYTSSFLSHCSLLRRLSLSFKHSMEHTEPVFKSIADTVRLTNLKDLSISGMRCRGNKLLRFLKLHPGLQKLKLQDLDITGSTSLASTFRMIADIHFNLRSFNANYNYQNSQALYLRTLGYIGFDMDPTTDEFEREFAKKNLEDRDFSDCFERVDVHYECCVAEEWEGVQRKMALMSDDLMASGLAVDAL